MTTITKKILLQEQLKDHYSIEYLELLLNDINILKTTLKKLNIKYNVNSEDILEIYEIIHNNIPTYIKNSDFIILDIERDIFNLIKEINTQDKKIIIDCNSFITMEFVKKRLTDKINNNDYKQIGIDYTNNDIFDNNLFYIINNKNSFIFNKEANKVKIIKIFESIIKLENKTLTLEEEMEITNGYKDV